MPLALRSFGINANISLPASPILRPRSPTHRCTSHMTAPSTPLTHPPAFVRASKSSPRPRGTVGVWTTRQRRSRRAQSTLKDLRRRRIVRCVGRVSCVSVLTDALVVDRMQRSRHRTRVETVPDALRPADDEVATTGGEHVGHDIIAGFGRDYVVRSI